MLIIGLAGGIASGKSFVADCFEQLGSITIDADKVGHEVLDQSDVQALLVVNFGSGVLDEGKVNRRHLAGIVFDSDHGDDQLNKLEEITHPRIRKRIESQMEGLRSEDFPAVVLDAPVMFRAGWDKLCDQIVFVDSPIDVRRQRARLRGWEDGELERRESRQVSVDEKRRRSTCVVDNSGNEQKTRKQIDSLWREWKLPQNSS